MDNCEIYNLQLDELTHKEISIYLYQNVQNIEDIHKKLISKELPCCVVKANLIVDPFQIVIAANRAALNEKYEQMVTRSLYTEIVYCLSPTKNISQSLETFGISNDTKNILVILVHKAEDKETEHKLICNFINGERIAISQLTKFTDTPLIRKTYKIQDEELKVSSLLDSIVSRISDKILK